MTPGATHTACEPIFRPAHTRPLKFVFLIFLPFFSLAAGLFKTAFRTFLPPFAPFFFHYFYCIPFLFQHDMQFSRYPFLGTFECCQSFFIRTSSSLVDSCQWHYLLHLYRPEHCACAVHLNALRVPPIRSRQRAEIAGLWSSSFQTMNT
jgi:hypothetical protein